VKELLGRVDSAELAEWNAYDSIDPIGNTRADLAAGVIASTIANVNRSEKHEAFSPTDFMLFYDKPEREPQSMESMQEVAKALVAMSKK